MSLLLLRLRRKRPKRPPLVAACKGINFDDEPCEYDDWLFCRNPECISPVMTETTFGSCPQGCPIANSWNNLTASYNEVK